MRKYLLIFAALCLGVHGVSAQNSEKARKLSMDGRKAYLRFVVDGYEKAVGFYEKALRADSSYVPAYAGLAETYALWGFEIEKKGGSAKPMYEKAIRYGTAGVAIDSSVAVIHRALAQACMNANPKELGAHAYASLEKARAIDSSDAETFYLLWLHTDNENPDSPFIKKSLSLDADFFQSHYGLGLLYAKRKDFDRAIDHYKECVRVNPKHPWPYYSLGHAYSQQKKYDLAIPEYENAIGLDENLNDAYFFLGLASYYERQDKKARQNLQRYLERVPDSGYRKQVDEMLKEIR